MSSNTANSFFEYMGRLSRQSKAYLMQEKTKFKKYVMHVNTCVTAFPNISKIKFPDYGDSALNYLRECTDIVLSFIYVARHFG